MPRDLPDWGAQSSQATVHEVTDLGELAARLESIDTFDRRGDVLWLDGFENGLGKWAANSNGAGGAADLSIVQARNGLYSARLLAGSDGDRNAFIERYAPYPVLSGFGVEFSFTQEASVDNVQLDIELFDGATVTSYIVRWDDVNNVLQYADDEGSFVTIASGVDLAIFTTLFHTVKLVVDAPNGVYNRLIVDDQQYSLAGIAAQSAVDLTLPRLFIGIMNTGLVGLNPTVYVDDVILTQNENV